MSYTDIELLIATQVAYLENGRYDYRESPDAGSYSVQDLMEAIEAEYNARVSSGGEISSSLQGDMDTVNCMRDILNKNNVSGDFLNDWHVVDVCDKNSSSGMYGCLIDTGDGNAIVGYRGSESEDFITAVKDWGIADVGLLNDTLTAQQADAQMYMQRIYEKYGDRYNSFSATGHSLGGNLAEHATITAPDGMNIERCVNYDGPGFSDNYARAHRGDIARNSHLVDHYQWSWVGSLLFPLKGSNYKTIYSVVPDDHGAMNLFFRHATNNVRFDNNGMVLPGSNSWFEILLGEISREAETYLEKRLVSLCPPLLAIMFLYEEGVIPDLIEGGYRLIGDMGNFVLGCLDTVIDRLNAAAESIYSVTMQAVTFFEDMFSGGRSGEYEVNAEVLRAVANDLDSIAARMNYIAGDIQAIRSRIPFQSPGVSILKAKIWRIGSRAESEAQKCRRLGNAAYECAAIYTTADLAAADCYY